MNDKRDRVDMLKNLTFSDCFFPISDCCFYGVKRREGRIMLKQKLIQTIIYVVHKIANIKMSTFIISRSA